MFVFFNDTWEDSQTQRKHQALRLILNQDVMFVRLQRVKRAVKAIRFPPTALGNHLKPYKELLSDKIH